MRFTSRRARVLAISAAVVLSALFFLVSCSRKSLVEVKPVKKAKAGEEFVVQSSERRAPRWTRSPEFEVDKQKGEKIILVTAEVYGPTDKRAAERLAEAELRKKVAEGIETLVQAQFQGALGGRENVYGERFRSYLVTVAENVPVVGLVVTETFWEKIQRFVSKTEVEYVYRVYKRGKMPYASYAAARDRAWQDVLERRGTEDEKEQLRSLIAEMKRQDEM